MVAGALLLFGLGILARASGLMPSTGVEYAAIGVFGGCSSGAGLRPLLRSHSVPRGYFLRLDKPERQARISVQQFGRRLVTEPVDQLAVRFLLQNDGERSVQLEQLCQC